MHGNKSAIERTWNLLSTGFFVVFFQGGGIVKQMLCGKASVFIELKTLSDQAFYFLNNRIPRKLHNFVNQPQTNHNYHC